MTTFSIVVPFFNNQFQVKKCIKSIIKNFKINKNKFEIILVDDSSSKIHYNQIRQFVAKNQNYRIRLIRNKKNCGPAQSRNIGAIEAKFKYIFFLDSDTTLHKDISKIILKNLKKNDVLVGHYHYKPSNNTIAGNFKAIFNYCNFSYKGVVNFETFNSACAVIKKKIFFDLGGFNKNIKWGMDYENEEFGRRIIKKHKIILDPTLTVMHEFPNLIKMFKLYFIRMIPYVSVILDDKKLENIGPGNSSTILSIFFSIMISINFVIYVISREYFYFIMLISFLFCFLISNLKFILMSIRIKPSQIFFFILIKFMLAHILFFALNIGIIKYILKKK